MCAAGFLNTQVRVVFPTKLEEIDDETESNWKAFSRADSDKLTSTTKVNKIAVINSPFPESSTRTGMNISPQTIKSL